MLIRTVALILMLIVPCGSCKETGNTDVEILSEYLYSVCKNRDYITMLYVASLVVNRVNSPAFADSVALVINNLPDIKSVGEDLIYGIFNSSDDEQVRKCCRRAAYEALNGCQPAGNILYMAKADDSQAFRNRSKTVESRKTVVSGGLVFYE